MPVRCEGKGGNKHNRAEVLGGSQPAALWARSGPGGFQLHGSHRGCTAREGTERVEHGGLGSAAVWAGCNRSVMEAVVGAGCIEEELVWASRFRSRRRVRRTATMRPTMTRVATAAATAIPAMAPFRRVDDGDEAGEAVGVEMDSTLDDWLDRAAGELVDDGSTVAKVLIAASVMTGSLAQSQW
jgi:hypothetical protein